MVLSIGAKFEKNTREDWLPRDSADIPHLRLHDRLLGFEMLRLVGSWPEWVHRRVETVTWESVSSIRRQISVDLRLRREYFGKPQFRWDDDDVHYVPIAQLEKQRLLGFDLRDEGGTSLPMMTRWKNSLIATGMLSALSQTLIANRMQAEDHPTFREHEIHAADFRLPGELEEWFWQLAYPLDGHHEAFSRFTDEPAGQRSEPGEWSWVRGADELWYSNASEARWRQYLLQDPGFKNLAQDVAERFLVCVPLKWQPGRRRIVKFSYSDYFAMRSAAASKVVKNFLARWSLVRGWNSVEDRLEGLPQDDGIEPEWMPGDGGDSSEPAGRSQLQALLQTAGLAAKQFVIVGTEPGHARSYHMTVNAPPGIQIRQAQLCLKQDGAESEQLRPIRGFRGVRQVDLYVSGALPEQEAEADLRVKPTSNMMVRGGALGAIFTWITLALAMLLSHTLIQDRRIDSAVALLVVIPGLVAAFASRDAGHPLATSMLVGLRFATLIPALGSFLMAGLLIFHEARSPGAYADLVVVGVDMIFLALTWRLADRGLPHPDIRPSSAKS